MATTKNPKNTDNGSPSPISSSSNANDDEDSNLHLHPDFRFQVMEKIKEFSYSENTTFPNPDSDADSDFYVVNDEDYNNSNVSDSEKMDMDSEVPSKFLPTSEWCLICLKNVRSASSASSANIPTKKEEHEEKFLSDEIESPDSTLHDFSKLFNISSTIYYGVDMNSLMSPLFCSSCSDKFSQSIGIVQQIEKLEKCLDLLKTDIKKDLVESYRCHPEGIITMEKQRENMDTPFNDTEVQFGGLLSTEFSKNKNRIRKAFAQCWVKSTIPIHISPMKISSPKLSPQIAEPKPKLRRISRTPPSNSSFGVANKNHLAPDPNLMEFESVLSPADFLDMGMNVESAEESESDSGGSLYTPYGDGDGNGEQLITISDSDDDGGGDGHGIPTTEILHPKKQRRGRPRKSEPCYSTSATIVGVGGSSILEEEEENPDCFQCTFCQRIFKKDDYKSHSTTGEGAKYDYFCDLSRCKFTKPFDDFSTLKNHHIRTCKSRPAYICQYCERPCYSTKSLKEHMAAKHTGSNPAVTSKAVKRKKLGRPRKKEIVRSPPIRFTSTATTNNEIEIDMDDSTQIQIMDEDESLLEESSADLDCFECKFCSRIFKKEDYKSKSTTETGEGEGANEIEEAKYVYFCDLRRCKFTKPFKDFSTLKNHHIRTCKLRPAYICQYCARPCYSAKSFKEHIAAKHADVELQLSNSNNNNSSDQDLAEEPPSQSQLLPLSQMVMVKPKLTPKQIYSSNIKVVTIEDSSGNPKSEFPRIHSFDCEFCQRTFNREDYKTETGEYVFLCDLPNCRTQKPFLTLPKLKQHHRNTCLSKPGFSCEYCDRRCYDEKTLKYHVISVHTKQYEFTCDHCGMGFANLGNLNGHLFTHREKSFKCPQCPKTFRKRSDVAIHAQRHGERILCEICGKGFRCQRDLVNHRFIHESEKKFSCRICGKFFKSRAYVDTHVWSAHKKSRKARQARSSASDRKEGVGQGQRSEATTSASINVPDLGPNPTDHQIFNNILM